MLISTFFKEDTNGARAEVHKTQSGYEIQYYDMNGDFMMSEEHHGKSLPWAESAAENWTQGIKNLNG
jgi:hypothetical protein